MRVLETVDQILTCKANTRVLMPIPVPRLYEHMVLTLLLLVVVVVVPPLAPAPTSAVPWPPAANMAPGPNSVPGSPF